MPRIVMSSLAVVLVMGLLLQSASAQQQSLASGRASNAARAKAAAASRAERGLDLLRSLADSARDIPDKHQRFRMLTCVADALWPHDAARARRLAERTFDDASNLDAGERPAYSAASCRSVRADLVGVVRRHDPVLAARFANDLERGLAPTDEAETDPYSRTAPLFERAQLLASDDPKAAAALTRQILAAGALPNGLDSIFWAIAEHDRPLAISLASETLDVAERTSQIPLALESFILPGWNWANPDGLDERLADQTLIRRYLEVLLTCYAREVSREALSDDGLSVRDSCFRLQSWLPLYERFASERVAELRGLLAQLRPRLSPDTAAVFDAYETGGRSGAIERLDAVASADDGETDAAAVTQRDETLWSAAQNARERNDFAKARELASRIRDPDQRDGLLAGIISDEMQVAENADRYSDVTRLASEISDRDARAYALADIARNEVASGRRERALALYDDAYRILTSGGTMVPVRGVAILLDHAKAVRPVDAERAFELVRDAVAAANRSSPYKPWRHRMGPSCATDFSEPFTELALADFDRAVGLARSIEDGYYSASALLAIALAALRAGPEPGKHGTRRHPSPR